VNNHDTLPKTKDYLWLNISVLPYFRALVRAVEARFYEGIDLPGPVLDVGCGDGHFASVAFDKPLDVGIDPWGEPIHQARKWNSYRILVQGNAENMPFPDGYFSSAVSNSVLEHIPNVDSVLIETARVLKPGAPFIFCVPNHNFLKSLSVSNAFDRLHLQPLGNSYRSFFNRISRHYHCDSQDVWQARLQKTGFEIDQFWHYYPPSTFHVTEWGHYFGLPAWITQKIFGRWILFPSKHTLFWIERITRPHYEQNPIGDDGVYSFYITHRIS
jgi:ubiquinone/menaquinone biosynthesis C-methylase UbiE